MNPFREGEKPVKTSEGGCEWSGDEKSAAVVTRPLGGLESRAGVEGGLLPPQIRVEVRVRCGEGTEGG